MRSCRHGCRCGAQSTALPKRLNRGGHRSCKASSSSASTARLGLPGGGWGERRPTEAAARAACSTSPAHRTEDASTPPPSPPAPSPPPPVSARPSRAPRSPASTASVTTSAASTSSRPGCAVASKQPTTSAVRGASSAVPWQKRPEWLPRQATRRSQTACSSALSR